MAVLDDSTSANQQDLVAAELIELARTLEVRLHRGDVTRAAVRSTLVRWAGAEATMLDRAARIAFHDRDLVVSDLLTECSAMLRAGHTPPAPPRTGAVIRFPHRR